MVFVEPDQIWMVVVGFIIAFVLAFGIGGNDVANSFGTSYGAKVLTLTQVCVLASVFETLGSVLLGAKVSDTIRKGIIDIDPYVNNTELLMVGNVSALTGSCVWLIVATLLRLPVSATHSIVGATVGFAVVAHGMKGINLGKLAMIIVSWFVSPVMAGIVSTCLFLLCKHFILNMDDPLESGLRWLPVFYAVTITINLFSVFYDGPEMLGFDKIPLWGTFVLSFGTGFICAILVRFAVVPWQRRRIKASCAQLALAAADSHPENEACRAPYTGPVGEPAALESGDGNQREQTGMRFSFSNDDCSSGSSSNSTSKHPSQDNLSQDEIALEKANINALQMTERKEKVDPESLETKNQKNSADNFLSPPIPATGKILAEITTAAKPQNGTKAAGINKGEDAPLVDNEYKLGSQTPLRSNTSEDLGKVAKAAEKAVANGTLEEKSDENDPNHSGRANIKDSPETVKLFSFLQILTAIFGGFAHGGNDVSNAIGPLVSLWLIGTTGTVSAKAATPIWILLYGGVGISLGLWLWGVRVMKTMGEDLTKITPSSGFCIEIGTAMTVLIASNIGIPISTTHCKVGSIVFVGRMRSRDNVDWSIFRNIVLAWLVTLPVSGGISAGLMAGLQRLI